jgi:hypothetical protein
MSHTVTVPDEIYERVAALAERRRQPVDDVVAATLARGLEQPDDEAAASPTSDTVETVPSPEAQAEARALGLDPTNISPLGWDLLHLRARGIAEGMHLSSWEELDAEIAEMRGEDED